MNKCIFTFCLLLTLYARPLVAQEQLQQGRGPTELEISSDDGKIKLGLAFGAGAKVTGLLLDGRQVLSRTGAYTAISNASQRMQSSDLSASSRASISSHVGEAGEVRIQGIQLGDVQESWEFTPQEHGVRWRIIRRYPKESQWEDMAVPVWHFGDIATFKGGVLDNGGMVWCKYFKNAGDTYGVHTGGVTFWNEHHPAALQLEVQTSSDKQVASTYSHHPSGDFTCTHYVTNDTLKQRYHLSRFVHGRPDVFAAFNTASQQVDTVDIMVRHVDYLQAYDRGNLQGIDTDAVRELLNTTGRYGVVDNGIVGANGWLTNWKCLHEPFFAQIGLALQDSNYTGNLAYTLDRERDYALQADGRVLSRWHDVANDEIPGTYDSSTGYYEAKWGYTVDSQTGYVINTAELFQQTGDLAWLTRHKTAIESALEWLLRRDNNGNHLYEMVNNTVSEQQASDWLDIVWAGFENAFVNAQLYEALQLWAGCEEVLQDHTRAMQYRSLASKLKESFNKPVQEGGFWLPEKKQYIYWRDQDGTIRGDNLVTPVNFAAIAFGICDDMARIDTILGEIERRTAAESLFHWPLCFDSFQREEVHDNNWPFPRYENGDIFPTWGYLGIRAYVKYDKRLALRYIHRILAQYRKDGLSSQRYSRIDQAGLGDDILAGISTTTTALYSDIYGIEPRWNRLGLRPHMVPELDGTSFDYHLRGKRYQIMLDQDRFQLQSDGHHIVSRHPFGMQGDSTGLRYYVDNREDMVLSVRGTDLIKLEVHHWENAQMRWEIQGSSITELIVKGLKPGARYALSIDGKREQVRVGQDGELRCKRKFAVSSVCELKPW